MKKRILVPAHRRKGKLVKAHYRVVEGSNNADSGNEYKKRKSSTGAIVTYKDLGITKALKGKVKQNGTGVMPDGTVMYFDYDSNDFYVTASPNSLTKLRANGALLRAGDGSRIKSRLYFRDNKPRLIKILSDMTSKRVNRSMLRKGL